MTARSDTILKSFHFQEMDWVIIFPNVGNEGRKYLYYSVTFIDRRSKDHAQICLAEIVDSPKFEANYPHTVGFFKGPIDENAKIGYLEIRVINSIEDFWKFLNDLDI